MRIAFVTTEYPTEDVFYGGLANYLARVARALADRSHDVHVITYSESAQETFVREGVTVHRVRNGAMELFLNRITRFRFPHSAKWIDFSWQAYRRLRQLHVQSPFDCAQYPNYLSPGLMASFWLPLPFTVRISSFASVWTEAARRERTLDTLILECLERIQLRWSRWVYAPSDTLARVIVKHTSRCHVEVIRPPFVLDVAEDQWEHSLSSVVSNHQYILYFGRFQPSKGFPIFVEAAVQFLESELSARVVFVGQDAGDRDVSSFREWAESKLSRFRDRTHFFGSLSHERLFPIIQGARLVVLPSLVDNFPNACLEAMALGRPVIGTRGASFDEMLEDQVSGFLVEKSDVQALADGIHIGWNHPDLEGIGFNARARTAELEHAPTDRIVEHFGKVIGSGLRRQFWR